MPGEFPILMIAGDLKSTGLELRTKNLVSIVSDLSDLS